MKASLDDRTRMNLESRGGRKCAECGQEAQHALNHNQGGWSPLWCRDCDAKRIDRISKNLEGMQEHMATTTNAKKTPPAQKIEDQSVQDAEQLKKIRTARRLVKRKELDFGRLTKERKLAKEELDAAVADLCRTIDGSPQAELFVGHVDKGTGEVEDDEA